MSVLALDIATKAGWAVWSPSLPIVFGTINLKDDEPTDRERLLRFWRELRDIHIRFGIDHLFYEKPISFGGKGGHAHIVVHQLVGIAEMWSAMMDIPADGVNPSTLKKFGTGNGRADKPMMIAAAERHWQVKVDDDNQADALLIMSWGMSLNDCQPPGLVAATAAAV